MLSRVFTSSALLKEPSRAAHALNAIGLCAKVAIIFGVNPMFLVNASRVGFESAGTCSGFSAVVLGIVFSLSYFHYCSSEIEHFGHRTTRFLRPVARPLRPDGQQHDRHFVFRQPELAVYRF